MHALRAKKWNETRSKYGRANVARDALVPFSALLSPKALILLSLSHFLVSSRSSIQIRCTHTRNGQNGRSDKKAHVQLSAESPILLPFFHPPPFPPRPAPLNHCALLPLATVPDNECNCFGFRKVNAPG